jgi:hypothetical protein
VFGRVVVIGRRLFVLRHEDIREWRLGVLTLVLGGGELSLFNPGETSRDLWDRTIILPRLFVML